MKQDTLPVINDKTAAKLSFDKENGKQLSVILFLV